MTKPLALVWLSELYKEIAIPPTRRKNMLDIAGYPSWENV